MKFKELNIIPEILKALEDESYTTPTPIQEKAIPPLLQGRDLLGCAQTGTGKTAAFAIPIIQHITEREPSVSFDKNSKIPKRNIQALILTPTRELALQIFESFRTYGKHTKLRYGVIFGGVSQKPQEEVLKSGIDVLVATPGRLNDLLNQKLVDLQYVNKFVLDEADHMLDMGFIHDVRKIADRITSKKQTLLFSATMPEEIAKLADNILINPVKIAITPVSSAVEVIRQSLYYVDKKNKTSLLLHLLKDTSITSVLVFTRTKHGADKVVKDLVRENISAQAIHGNKSQNARQNALENFKSRTTRVLVATDIAARGIDIDELSHVINYELPNISETYIHRIGRTGRAGLGGVAISFCDYDEKEWLTDIEKLLGKRIPVIDNHPFPMQIFTPSPKATQPMRRIAKAIPIASPKQDRASGEAKALHKRNNDFKKNNRTGFSNRRKSHRNNED